MLRIIEGVPLTLKESAGRAGQNLGGMVRSGMFMPANNKGNRQEADTAASAGMKKSQEY